MFMMDLVYLPKNMFHDTHSVNEVYRLFNMRQTKAQHLMYTDVLCSESERFSVKKLKNFETPHEALH